MARLDGVRVARKAAMRLRIAADVERLAEVRSFVRDAVRELGGTARDSDDLVQAVDEVTCNVMLHGYDGAAGDIELEARELDGRIEITILDRAPVFDPTGTAGTTAAAAISGAAAQPAPRVSRRPGTAGVGLHLARTMTDSVRHHVRPGGGNEVTLVRTIDDGGNEAAHDRSNDRTDAAEEG